MSGGGFPYWDAAYDLRFYEPMWRVTFLDDSRLVVPEEAYLSMISAGGYGVIKESVSLGYNLTRVLPEDRKWFDTLDLEYEVLAYYKEVKALIAYAEDMTLDEMNTVIPEVCLIPPDNILDITVTIPWHLLVIAGTTLHELASSQLWWTQLEDAGLRVDSIESSPFSATMIIHCTTMSWVNINELVLSDQSMYLAGFGSIKAAFSVFKQLKNILIALGVVAGAATLVLGFRIVALLRIKAETEQIKAETIAKLTQLEIDAAYALMNKQITQQTYDAIRGTTDTLLDALGGDDGGGGFDFLPDIDMSNIVKWGLVAAAGVAAIVLIPKLIPDRK